MNKFRTVLLSSLAVLSLGLVSTSVVVSDKKETVIFVSAAESVQSYYSSITDDMTGETLLNALNALNTQKRTSTVGYAGMRQFAKKSDADPNGSGKILSFYDNKLVGPEWDGGNTWNREHVWPNVRGGNKVENDAHMVRPSSTSTNSGRGSKGYGMSSYDPGQFVEYYRGSASRIIFYAAIADLSLNLVDDPLNYHGAGQYPNSMGSLSEMLEWNLQYLPSDTSFTGGNDIARRAEINRNNVIQTDSSGQGNRNPFIDHPEYACRIWGNYNSKTKQICDGSVIPPDPPEPPVEEDMTGLSLDVKEKHIEIGEEFQLNALIEPDSLTGKVKLEWFSNDDSVATVTKDGLVKGIKDGETTIVVTTEDFTFQDQCVVTVGKGKTSAPSKNGCGGNIATTSVLLSMISLVGIALFLIRNNFGKEK